MPAWLGWIAVVLLSLYLAVFPMAAAGLAWRWGRGDRLRLVLLFAAAWIVTEWLRATLFTGFAWNPLGVLWVPLLPVAGAAKWIGTYGLSGLFDPRRRAAAAAGRAALDRGGRGGGGAGAGDAALRALAARGRRAWARGSTSSSRISASRINGRKASRRATSRGWRG